MNSAYYAVIFTSLRNENDPSGYEKMADRMIELAKEQKGFVGVESARSSDGFGITVSYWQSKDDIRNWKSHSEHQMAQEFGRSKWYTTFTTRICEVQREYSFSSKDSHD